ncbi:glycosyltransferase family 2 protein [Psychroserpens algicola]|uniref:Glycosyltransferase family 2 protein n=1 Tax=Psychroserpens algicola TaxID=1719034 RepID=A0ABT0H5G8_9FLAO|nr:glycosyltransferase family 2 protein [Psychroserpens algicola]MCK8479595.1 glycosyltransferase family 2 protein [Psychroserpens algicola]
MDYSFTIIVPIYNEEDNLERLEKALISYLKKAAVSTKVLFINDGSNDGSQTLIEAMCCSCEEFEFITFSENKGLSTALKAGFDHVSTSLVGYMDADLQTNPEDFNLLLEHVETYDLVTGVRSDRKDSFLKKLSSKLANSVRRLFTKDGVDDTGCPLKIIKTEAAKRIPMFRGLHRFLPAMILLQQGTVKQVHVRHYPRVAGQAKFGFWNRSIGPLVDCFVFLWMKKKYINYGISKTSK